MLGTDVNIGHLLGKLCDAAAEPGDWLAFLHDLEHQPRMDASSNWDRAEHKGSPSWSDEPLKAPEADPQLCAEQSWAFENSELRGALTLHGYLGTAPRSSEHVRPRLQRESTSMDAKAQANVDLHALLAPHVRSVLDLRYALESTRAERSMLRKSAETVDLAIASLDAEGDVLYRTRAAQDLLAAGDGLVLRGRRLRAKASAEHLHLVALLQQAKAGEQGAMLISRQSPRRPLQLIVTPVPCAQHGLQASAAVLVFLCDPDAVPASRAPLLRQLYGLSPTECRLADQLAAGVELQTAAERLRLTVQTARFHLKAIFRKTETNRQTDLVRLVLGLPGAMH